MAESNFVYGPPETSERNTLYPATTGVLEVQVSATKWETVCVPFPEREIVAGEFVALLATVALPGKLPLAAGVNIAANVADCPDARIKPLEIPLAE